MTRESMGITIVQKSDLKKKKGAKTALILAGGAVTGGSFMAGGLKALNNYMTGFAVTDFDIFVGISSGSLLAAPIMAGIMPEEMLKSLDGTSERFSELSPLYYYRPNLKEFVARPLAFCVRQILNFPRIEIPSLLELLPSGLFDNSSIEKYLRNNIEKNHLTNSFEVAHKVTKKSLYISAMTVDGAKRVIFGHDENNKATISEAVQASTSMPGFYKPARINGVDYVDGGVQETANIDIAIRKGAELIICYNPFRPYDNKVLLEHIKKENRFASKDRRLSDDGVMAVINQIFRAMFHSRLHVALDHYRADPKFKGDIILIEPKADDAAFFGLNPLVFGNRIKAAALGYKSVRNSIDEMYKEIAEILNSYGIGMSKAKVEKEIKRMKKAGESGGFLREVMEEDVSKWNNKRFCSKKAKKSPCRKKRKKKKL